LKSMDSHNSSQLTATRRSRLILTLPLLMEAQKDAEEARLDQWEFSLTSKELITAGMVITDLRWLVTHELVIHKYEKTVRSDSRRKFLSAPMRSLNDQSCFVLTQGGCKFIQELTQILQTGGKKGDKEVPMWNSSTRKLTWKEEVVKVFRTPAPCQERVLAVFEEENWPERIDDPLQGIHGHDQQQRLHYVVRRLNGKQRNSRIHFSRDGTGKGICWSAC
jgi:hypothetical protein